MTNTIPNVPRELKPCPFCGDSELLGFEPSNEGGWTIVRCRRCGASGSTGRSTSEWEAAAYWNRRAPSPAGVDGLGVVAWQHWGDQTKLLCALGKDRGIPGGYTDEFTLPLCRLSDAQAIIDGLRGEVADLHTTMMAAAVEIQEHWAAHCDEEGYGPANLMHRLERGIASQYGYSAETLVRLESQRDQQAQRIGELEGLLRSCLPALSDGGCAALANRIDAALAAVCAAAPNITPTSEHSGS